MTTIARSTLLALVTAALGSAPALAAPAVTGTPKVGFVATGGMLIPDIEGTTSALTVANDGTALLFTVGLSNLTSGIDLRDEHMKGKYLEVPSFPHATLKIERSALSFPASGGEKKKGKAAGSFTVHGVTQPVNVAYTLVKTNAGYKVDATFNLDLAKHGIPIPEYEMVSIEPGVVASASFEFSDAP